jgi:signal peptidase I
MVRNRTLRNKTGIRIFWDYFFAIILSIVVALLLRRYVIAAYQISNDSMVPTLLNGDYIFVNKLSYVSKRPRRGDVVLYIDQLPWIKRVAGLPGESFAFKNGEWTLNDNAATISESIQVPMGSLFVVGDNSKSKNGDLMAKPPLEFVPLNHVQGQAIFIGLSYDHQKEQVRWERIGKRLK